MIRCIKPKTWFHNGYKAFRSANLVLVAAWLLQIPLPDEEEGISCTRQNVDAVPCVAAERCIANAITQEAFYNPAHTGLHNPSEKVANAQELGSSYSTDIQAERKPLSLILMPSNFLFHLQKTEVLWSQDARPDFSHHGDFCMHEYNNTNLNWSGRAHWVHFHYPWKNS